VSESRIEEARRRAAGAKQVAVVTAAAGFLGVVLLARAGHPGHSATALRSSRISGTTSSTRSESESDDFSFGSSSVAPSGGSAPQVQTSVS
jgi:hypothetical protein